MLLLVAFGGRLVMLGRLLVAVSGPLISYSGVLKTWSVESGAPARLPPRVD